MHHPPRHPACWPELAWVVVWQATRKGVKDTGGRVHDMLALQAFTIPTVCRSRSPPPLRLDSTLLSSILTAAVTHITAFTAKFLDHPLCSPTFDRGRVTAVDGRSENAILGLNLFILLLLNYVKWSWQYGHPVPDVTVRHLLWVPKASQYAVTPTYKQFLNAFRISVVMACDGLLEWSLNWNSHWCVQRHSNVSKNATEKMVVACSECHRRRSMVCDCHRSRWIASVWTLLKSINARFLIRVRMLRKVIDVVWVPSTTARFHIRVWRLRYGRCLNAVDRWWCSNACKRVRRRQWECCINLGLLTIKYNGAFWGHIVTYRGILCSIVSIVFPYRAITRQKSFCWTRFFRFWDLMLGCNSLWYYYILKHESQLPA